MLRRLSDAGLDVLNISVDDFHQATIPFERVKISYEAAKRLGIRIVVMTALSKSSKLRLADVSRLLGDEIPPPRGAVPWEHAAIGIESGFTPVGRGAAIPRNEWYIDGSPLTGGCGAVLRDLGVRPSGEVLPAARLPRRSEDSSSGTWTIRALRKCLWTPGGGTSLRS